MTSELSSRTLAIRGLVAVAAAVLGRLTTVWLLGDPPADTRPLVAVIDYIICGIAVLTTASTGWWAGTGAQTAASRSIDRRFAAVLHRWRDLPRGRAHDLMFVNAVTVFALRIGNAVVRPTWRRAIGLTTAVLLITVTWLAADAVTPTHLPTTASAAAAALHGLGLRYAQTGAAATWVGCLVLFANALHVTGQMLFTGRRPRNRRDT